MPNFIWIGVEGKFVPQLVKYEKHPKYCMLCGYDIEECRENRGNKKTVLDLMPKDLCILLNKNNEKMVVDGSQEDLKTAVESIKVANYAGTSKAQENFKRDTPLKNTLAQEQIRMAERKFSFGAFIEPS